MSPRHLVVALAALLLTASPSLAQESQSAQDRRVIVTHGEARLERAPDQAFVSIAAETRATTPVEAQRLAAEAMTSVQNALKQAGIAADAIRTTGYSLRPNVEYENGRSRVRGYIARNQIEVRVDVLDRIGAVIDVAGSTGATSLAGLRFDLKNRRAAEQEALKLAVEDATARARAIAAGAGASLGPIVRIEEQFTGRPQPPPVPYMTMRAEAAQAPETPVSPGEVEIVAQVRFTVAIR